MSRSFSRARTGVPLGACPAIGEPAVVTLVIAYLLAKAASQASWAAMIPPWECPTSSTASPWPMPAISIAAFTASSCSDRSPPTAWRFVWRSWGLLETGSQFCVPCRTTVHERTSLPSTTLTCSSMTTRPASSSREIPSRERSTSALERAPSGTSYSCAALPRAAAARATCSAVRSWGCSAPHWLAVKAWFPASSATTTP